MSIGINEGIKIIENIGRTIEENREYLTELDSAIGDADHGINMNKGFKAVSEKLKSQNIKDFGELFKLVGMTLVSTVGGASGPLYGTAFIKAGMVSLGKAVLDIKDFYYILENAVEGIKSRGKAEKGDKTMLDALVPALESVKISISKEEPADLALLNACEAAKNGMIFTKTIAARKGRASYLGERSINHQDPGATSSYLILNTIYETIKGLEVK